MSSQKPERYPHIKLLKDIIVSRYINLPDGLRKHTDKGATMVARRARYLNEQVEARAPPPGVSYKEVARNTAVTVTKYVILGPDSVKKRKIVGKNRGSRKKVVVKKR